MVVSSATSPSGSCCAKANASIRSILFSSKAYCCSGPYANVAFPCDGVKRSRHVCMAWKELSIVISKIQKTLHFGLVAGNSPVTQFLNNFGKPCGPSLRFQTSWSCTWLPHFKHASCIHLNISRQPTLWFSNVSVAIAMTMSSMYAIIILPPLSTTFCRAMDRRKVAENCTSERAFPAIRTVRASRPRQLFVDLLSLRESAKTPMRGLYWYKSLL